MKVGVFVLVLCLSFFSVYAATTQCDSCNSCTAAAISAGDTVLLNTSLSVSSGMCINITASSVTLSCSGNTIAGNKNTGSSAVFVKDSATNASILNCVLKDFETAIYLNNSDNTSVRNNFLINNTYGFFTFSASYATVRDNNFTNNQYSLSFNSNNNIDNLNAQVLNNTIFSSVSGWGTSRLGGFGGPHAINFTNNYVNVQTSATTGGFDHPRSSTFHGNTVFTTSIFIGGQDGSSNTLRNNYVRTTTATYLVAMYNGGDWRYINNTFVGIPGASGILSDRFAGSTIVENNTFINFSTGAYFQEGFSNSRLHRNTFTFVTQAIVLIKSYNNTITENVIENVSLNGVFLSNVGPYPFAVFAANNTISGNTFKNTLNAIYFADTTEDNILGQNTYQGVTNTVVSVSNKTNTLSASPLKITRGSSSVDWASITGEIGNLNRSVLLNSGIISINATGESAINRSANVTIHFGASCPVIIRYYMNFTNDTEVIKASGQDCDEFSTPACTNIVCDGTTVTFNVPHFDSYGVEGTYAIVPEFNAGTLLLVLLASLFIISTIRRDVR